MTQKLIVPDDINQFLEDAWLGLGDTNQIITKDILIPKEEDIEKWGMTPLRVLTNPEYIGYAAKVFLNIELLPIQCVIMQEMWTC